MREASDIGTCLSQLLFPVPVRRLPGVPLPDAVQGLDLVDRFVVAEPDEPGKPQRKSLLVIGALLDLGIPDLDHDTGLEPHLFPRIADHPVPPESLIGWGP